jgi:hypothetical protein
MKKILYKIWGWAKPYCTWRMAPCLALAWIITNAWGYILLGIGVWLDIGWAKAIGGGYVALLYMPFFIEKPITIAIAVFIQKRLFKKKGVTNGELETDPRVPKIRNK